MDPVSEATLAWLERRATGEGRRATSFSAEVSAQSALTRAVHGGVADAVRDVITPEQHEIVLTTLMRESPVSRAIRVAARASLPQTLVTYLSPQFQELADRGVELDSSRLAEVLTRHIGVRLVGAARRQALPPLVLALLPRLPGKPFDIDDFLDYLNDDRGEQQDGQDDEGDRDDGEGDQGGEDDEEETDQGVGKSADRRKPDGPG